MVDQTAPSVKSRQAKRKDGSPRKAAKGGHGKSAAPRAAHAGARQHALSNVCQLALQSTAIDTFLNESAKAVAAALNIESVGVFELSDDEKVLRLAGRFGWPEKSGEINVIPAAVCRPLYEALSANDAVKFEAAQFNVLPQSRNAAGNGMATAIGERSKRAGILTVHAKGRRRDFDESDASFLQTIAFIIAAVWERHGFEATLMQRNRALEALEQGVMITDARRLDDPLIYVNPAFERLTGYRTDEVIGKNPRFLQGSATDRNVVTNLRQGAAEGHSFRNTIVNYRKDGGEFWNDLTVSPVRDANDTTTHHVGILSDVTERVHLEEQLRQAQKMEAIGHLTGGIAHDFNNLLAVIIGNSEILLEDVTDDSLRDIAALVMKTAESGAVLTQRLLAFGRRQALSPEPFDVPKAIESLTDMLQRALGEQIRLVSRDDVSDRCAMVDRAQFESAILNLAVNARDAMPDGGELNIESKLVKGSDAGMPPELENGEYLRVSVRDTGTGMSPDVLAKVFEPFFTTKDVGRGSGLGLAMVYGFAKQSGGHVSIDSELSKGTTINLYLPVAEKTPAQVATKAPGKERTPSGSETILLVEDEAEVRKFVSRLLARLGYSVLEAEDAMSALKVLETVNEIDLLFSDLILPGGTNGLKLVEKAKKMRPELQILLTTGYTDEYERLSASSPGRILRKPYRRQDIATMLREVLDQSGHDNVMAARANDNTHSRSRRAAVSH